MTPLELPATSSSTLTAHASFMNFTWTDAINDMGFNPREDLVEPMAAAPPSLDQSDFSSSLLAFLEPLSPGPASRPSASHAANALAQARPSKPVSASKKAAAAAAAAIVLKPRQPQLSPRSEAIREKSREAVRRCRQRKREQEEGVRRRISDLEAENDKMRERISAGSEACLSQTNQEIKQLTEVLVNLLVQHDAGKDVTDRLERTLALFYDRRHTHSSNREIALSLVHARVSRRVQPAPPMKLYLWHSTCPDAYFERADGMWAILDRALGLGPEQKQTLLKRRAAVASLRAQVVELAKRVKEVGALTAQAARDVELGFLDMARQALSAVQLARLIVWMRDQMPLSPRVEPAAAGPHHLPMPVPRPNTATHASSVELAKERIILLTQGLWDAPNDRLFEIATTCCSKDVTLLDPNNGGEFHGLNATLAYVRRIRLAFSDAINVTLRSLHVDGERARATWVLSGTYSGKLGVKPRRVSFAIVVTYRLSGGLIGEMLVSWDALALMRQLGLFNGGGRHGAGAADAGWAGPRGAEQDDAVARAGKRQKHQFLSKEELAEAQTHCIEDLAKMFGMNPAAITEAAGKLLDTNCVFQDSYVGGEFRGVEACATYAQKVRAPFPTFKVVEWKPTTNEGSALGSPVRVDWTIKAVYVGPAAAKPTECKFSAIVFVTFDETKIDSVHFSWNAPQLMSQLRGTQQE
jgi:predicted ester cyclase